MLRRDASHVADDGLDDDASNLVLELAEGGFDCTYVVVGQRQCELDEFFWHAGRSGNAEGRDTRARLHQQRVAMTVIAALKLHDHLAARGGAR